MKPSPTGVEVPKKIVRTFQGDEKEKKRGRLQRDGRGLVASEEPFKRTRVGGQN